MGTSFGRDEVADSALEAVEALEAGGGGAA